MALTTDTSILTAIGNDYAFDQIYAKQVQALGQPAALVPAAGQVIWILGLGVLPALLALTVSARGVMAALVLAWSVIW